MGNFDIVLWLLRAVAVLLALTIHEVSHGYMAYLCGDKTAKAMGRLSFNPLRHIDPVGAICLLLFRFGWAKPVMVNPMYFRKPKRDMILVSLAGPLSNFIMAFVSLLVFKILLITGLIPPGFLGGYLLTFLYLFLDMNIGLCVFNLLPIPPLDGSKIFLPLLPSRLYYDIMRYEHLGWLILVAALALGVLDPIIGTAGKWLEQLLFFLVGGV